LWATANIATNSLLADSIHCVVCSPSAPTAVTTGRDGYARLWDLPSGRLLCPPLAIGGTADTRASFSPDGRRLVTSCHDGPVRVWDAATGKPIFPALLGNGTARLALFRPDGQAIGTAGKDGRIELWDATTGQLLLRFAGTGSPVHTFAFSHDSQTVLAGCAGYAVRFDASTGNRLGPALKAREEHVWEVEFSRDDSRLLTLAGDPYRIEGLMQVWDAASSRLLGPPQPDRIVLPAGKFHPGGRFIATGDWENKARLWDAKSATPIGPALGEPGWVQALAFSPDGRTLAVGAHDGTLTLWPIPDALSGSAEQIQVWLEWATGQELDDSGAAHELGPHDREERREALRKQGGAPLDWLGSPSVPASHGSAR
jgi:WD40 repeat protein